MNTATYLTRHLDGMHLASGRAFLSNRLSGIQPGSSLKGLAFVVSGGKNCLTKRPSNLRRLVGCVTGCTDRDHWKRLTLADNFDETSEHQTRGQRVQLQIDEYMNSAYVNMQTYHDDDQSGGDPSRCNTKLSPLSIRTVSSTYMASAPLWTV